MTARLFNISDISKFRQELMGLGIIGVLLSHLVSVGEFDTNNVFVQVLLIFKQLVYTQGFLFLSGFGLFFSMAKNADYLSFIKRRVNRLYIPFLVMTLPFFVFQVVVRSESIWCLLGRLTTVSFWIEGNYSGMWYVAISVLLYLLFPLYYKVVFANNRDEKMVIKIAWGGVILSILAHYLFRVTPYYEMVEIGVAKIPAFFIGPIFAFLLMKNNKRLTRMSNIHMALVLVVWLALSLWLHDTEGRSIILKFVFIPLSCVVIRCLYGIKSLSGLNVLLKWFGKYSLELYVLHLIILKTPELLPLFSSKQLVITGIIIALATCSLYSILSNRIAKWISGVI